MTDNTITQLQAAADAAQKALTDAKIEAERQARAARMAARKAERENHIERMFVEYAEPFGVPRSVSDKAYALAWEHGHASGYSEVESYFQDFADLAHVAYERGISDTRNKN